MTEPFAEMFCLQVFDQGQLAAYHSEPKLEMILAIRDRLKKEHPEKEFKVSYYQFVKEFKKPKSKTGE